VADAVYALELALEHSSSGAAFHRVATQPGIEELTDADHAVLATGELGDGSLH
jgi:hypothetical protein